MISPTGLEEDGTGGHWHLRVAERQPWTCRGGGSLHLHGGHRGGSKWQGSNRKKWL